MYLGEKIYFVIKDIITRAFNEKLIMKIDVYIIINVEDIYTNRI